MMAATASFLLRIRHLGAGLLCAMMVAGFLAGPASAQGNSQQERMKACNAQAGQQNLSGDTRKSFMSDCLSGKAAQTTPANSQQQKMKTCNTEAATKKLTGDARKTFMSGCLKG